MIWFDKYTDELKRPVPPKDARFRIIFLYEDDSDHFTSTITQARENGFTGVDFEETSKWY